MFSGRRGGFASRGADVRARLEIDLEEAILGAKRRIAFSDGRNLDVAIPRGAIDGQVLRLKGQGAPGRAGAGDALIELSLRPHPIFKREGETLVMDLAVSVPDAVLGGKVQAPTPEGPVTLSVPGGRPRSPRRPAGASGGHAAGRAGSGPRRLRRNLAARAALFASRAWLEPDAFARKCCEGGVRL